MALSDVFDEVADTLEAVGVRPNYPQECRQFVERFISEFKGTREELVAEIRLNSRRWFRSLSDVPLWAQEPEWQFNEGRPMPARVASRNWPVPRRRDVLRALRSGDRRNQNCDAGVVRVREHGDAARIPALLPMVRAWAGWRL